MNLLRNDLLMRKTGDRRRTELTEESASQCGLSAEFITPSRDVLLPGEDEAVLIELGEHVWDELQPVGALESLLVNRVISSTWRLQRLGRVEAGIFVRGLYGEMADRARKEAETYTTDLMDFTRTADTTITNEDKHREAVSK